MFDQSSAGLDQAFPERSQRPGFDRLRRRDGAQEVGEVVSQGMKLEPHSIGREAHAGQPRPLQSVLAFLDMLLRRSPIIVKGQDPLVRQTAVGDDKSDLWEQFTRMELDLGHDAPGL